MLSKTVGSQIQRESKEEQAEGVVFLEGRPGACVS